eukprot:113053-Prorocentrum_minimum.AAC.2
MEAVTLLSLDTEVVAAVMDIPTRRAVLGLSHSAALLATAPEGRTAAQAEELAALCARVPALAQLAGATRAELARHLAYTVAGRGDEVVAQGQPADKVGVGENRMITTSESEN